MFDFALANKQIDEKSSLSVEIAKLIDLIIDQKKFIFSKEEVKFDLIELRNHEIVDLKGDKINILHSNLFFYIAYLKLIEKLSFSISNDSEALFVFLQKIREYFDSENNFGFPKFMRGLSTMAIFHQHFYFKTDLLKSITSWSKEEESHLYIFTEAFSQILPYQQFDPNTLLKILRKLYSIHEYYKPDIINADINKLGLGIRKFSLLNFEKANALATLLINDYDSLNESISINVFAGLVEANKSFLNIIEKLALDERYQAAIVVSLSNQDSFSEAELEIVLQIISTIKNDSKKYRLQLPRFYSSALKTNSELNIDMVNQIFSSLNFLITDLDIDLPITVLQAINVTNEYEKEKIELLLLLLKQPHFDIRLIPNISWFFFNFADSKLYFEFLIAFAYKFKYKLDEKIFEHSIPHLRDKHPVNFDIELIRCLINDEGEIRWMAQRLVNKMCFFNDVRKFAFDILELSPIKQFKLFTSIFSMLNEPSVLLPLLLPLIETKNEFVKESFIYRMEILTEDYGNNVIKSLDEHWPIKTSDQQNVYNRIEDYMKVFFLEVNKKNKIKEFNPIYTQSKYYNSFLDRYEKIFRRNLNENIDKNSIFRQLATTVILAKGGGWKHQETGEVSQLSTFGSSFTFPTSYFISPDNFEWDKHVERLENWKNILSEWEAIL